MNKLAKEVAELKGTDHGDELPVAPEGDDLGKVAESRPQNE